jgi:hypothetical protein
VLDHRDFPFGRPPDDAGEIKFVAEPRQGFERAKPRRLRGFEQQIDAAVGAAQGRLGHGARWQKIGDDTPQLADERKQCRLHHQAFAQIDQIMREALSKPDAHRLARVTRACKAEPCPPPHPRNRPQRLDDTGIDPDPFQRVQQPAELDRSVEIGVEVLQSTSPAAPEMATRRRNASRARIEKFDDVPFQSAAAAGAEPGTHMVARHGEREKNGLAPPSRDAVPGGADAVDRQFHQFAFPSPHCDRILAGK